MAVKVKAILVGAFEGNKLYYLLQPHGETMLDGAVVSVDGQIDFVKFFHFITTTPQIQELQFSKFHKFLWSPGSATEEREKWNRIFLKKTQPIGDDLLIGATVITTLGAEEIKRKNYQIRADEFRRKTASTGGKPMEMTILSRKSLFNTRGAIGFKALGPLLGGKPSLDGDGDGFVDDGLPTMRPFIPGFDFLPDTSMERGLRSITTRRTDKVEDRSATREQMLDAVENVADIVARRYNNGKKIKTRKDAMDVLTRVIPSFGLPVGDKSRSNIEFLDSKNDGDILKPWESAYLNQFLFMIGDDPSRNDVTWNVKPMSKRYGPSTGGYTKRPGGNKDYRLSQKFSDEGPRFIPQKLRRPRLTIGYSAETDKQNSRNQLLNLLFKQDKKNFNALSYAISKALRDDLSKEPNQAKIIRALEYKYGLDIASGIEHYQSTINGLVAQNNLTGQEASIPSSALSREMLNDIWTGIFNSAEEISKVDPSFDPNLLLSKTRKAIQQGSIKDLLKSLAKTKEAFVNSLNSPNLKDAISDAEKLLDKWLPVNSKLVGVHESTHALHFLRMEESIRKRARKLRDEYLERYVERQKRAGLAPETFKKLQSELPIESFFPDVYKEEIRQYAEGDLDSFKRDILMLATGGTAGAVIPDKLVGTSKMIHEQVSSFTTAIELINNPIPGTHRYDFAQSLGIVEPLDMAKLRANYPDVIDQDEIDELVEASKTAKINAVVQSLQSWLNQPIFFGNEPVVLNDYLANLLNEMQANISDVPTLLGLSTAREYKAGESITPAIASLLINPSIIRREQSSRRNVMRGIKMYEVDNNGNILFSKTAPTVILSSLGFPDLMGDNGRIIKGGLPGDVKPLVDALIGSSALARDTQGKMARGIQEIRNAAQVRAEPDSVDLPKSFGDMSLSEFNELSADEVLEYFNKTIDNSLSDISTGIQRGQIDSTNSYVFEVMPGTPATELAPLNSSEIKIMQEIARKVGLPAGAGNSTGLGSIPAQGYSSYQATLVDPITWLGQYKWSIAEFVAESAVADFMGIPFSQVADSGLNTREFTNEELQVLNKLLQWVFSGRLPSDRMSEVFNP
jgi:hypothetical protein